MFLETPPVTQQDSIIAGSHSGKPVCITPDAKLVYDEVKRLSDQGNHWARLTVSGIQSLIAGRLHQNNIFVHPNAKHRNGTEEFVIILPGCKVTAEKLDSDGFRILHLKPDLNYFELQKGAEKPGLYAARSISSGWDTKLIVNGQIKNKKRRYVGITDSKHRTPNKAAAAAASRIEGTLGNGADILEDDGFDVHFTPGTERIGGLINYRSAVRPTGNKDLNESALLLAKTMYDARNTEKVSWYSEFGGSGVLTQAMKILVDQGVKLEGHSAYLFNPRTSPNEALKLAVKLELTIKRQFLETGKLDYIGNRDQFELIANRLKLDKKYSVGKAGEDLWATKTKFGAWGPLLSALGVTAVAASAAPAVITFLGAFALASAKVVGTGTAVNVAAKQMFPDAHDKIKRKLLS